MFRRTHPVYGCTRILVIQLSIRKSRASPIFYGASKQRIPQETHLVKKKTMVRNSQTRADNVSAFETIDLLLHKASTTAKNIW